MGAKLVNEMNSSSMPPGWRCFENITSGAEAASLAASCVFSLATLEASQIPDCGGFALTERKEPQVWRWAVIGPVGILVEEGYEATQDGAKSAAEKAVQLTQSSPKEALAT
jgi:hypothetical protein